MLVTFVLCSDEKVKLITSNSNPRQMAWNRRVDVCGCKSRGIALSMRCPGKSASLHREGKEAKETVCAVSYT